MELGQLYQEAKKARYSFENSFRAAYPPEGPVSWMRGGLRAKAHDGIVIRYGYGERLEVRNLRTLRTYWISMTDVLATHVPS
ncbi:hypothetical protein CSW60_18430 [Caulobacter sp. X]|nr:hypothetical protein CSW60_18430 [Caulobacter sp. X]